VLQLLPQIAIADTACIVALPLAIDPPHALRAAGGAAAVIAAAAAVYALLRWLELRGSRKRVHDLSERRKFAIELRVQLVMLFALASLAVRTHVSIMLAGFAFGLGVSALGEPRRLARQLFALTEGLFGPLFFIWLGASLDLRALGSRPAFLGLGVLLGVGAVATHLAPRLFGQPTPMGLLASAQLGVPVAAAAIGTQTHVLESAEASALILGALVTIAVTTAGGALAVRVGLVGTRKQPKDAPVAGCRGAASLQLIGCGSRAGSTTCGCSVCRRRQSTVASSAVVPGRPCDQASATGSSGVTGVESDATRRHLL
jgi:Kef-type K+ transport system membrane component KefB